MVVSVNCQLDRSQVVMPVGITIIGLVEVRRSNLNVGGIILWVPHEDKGPEKLEDTGTSQCQHKQNGPHEQPDCPHFFFVVMGMVSGER